MPDQIFPNFTAENNPTTAMYVVGYNTNAAGGERQYPLSGIVALVQSETTPAEIGAAPNTVNVLAGTGMTGGGPISANVTLTLANTAVVAQNYGNATQVGQIAVDAQGRITAASNITVTPAYSSLTGVPSTFAPSAHASSHYNGGSDPVTITNLAGFSANTTAFLRQDGTFAVPAATAPGGASGDLQYNNGGVFGGYTPGTGVVTFIQTPSSANLLAALTDETGTGLAVFSNNAVLITPNLGTPSAAILTNATGLPISTGVAGLGTGVATFLATPSSANLEAAVTDETGTGNLVFSNNCVLVTPNLGTPSALTLTNATGLPPAGLTTAAKTFSLGFGKDGGGSALSTGALSGAIVCPVAANIVAYSISVDTGTATVQFWKRATGTAIPVAANSISTSGVAIATGTHVRSTTLTDFTTTTVAANDILMMNIAAVSGATWITVQLELTK